VIVYGNAPKMPVPIGPPRRVSSGYESSRWYGLLAPAGTPADILNLLNAQVAKIMQSAKMKARMGSDGLVPIGGSREQFAAHLRAEIDGGRR
jgi:tripartite-type tricarboxylate transporter receptor subunit TctC